MLAAQQVFKLFMFEIIRKGRKNIIHKFNSPIPGFANRGI